MQQRIIGDDQLYKKVSLFVQHLSAYMVKTLK